MPLDSVGSLPFTILALVTVLVLAWFVVRVLARLGVGKSSGSSHMRIIQSLPAGARERIVLLEFDGKHYLLGVTAGGISVLERRAGTAPDDAVPPLSDIEHIASQRPPDSSV